jgi:hypothetical protein
MIRRLRAALIVLVAVSAGFVVVTAEPAAAETEVICPNSPIPVGWIHSDSFSVFSVCGSPGPVPPWIVTQWEITRISDRFRDDLVNMCIDTGVAIPAGWAEIASSAVPGRCGYMLPQPGAAPNVRLIKCLNCPLRPPPLPTPTPTIGGLDAITTTGAVLGWAQDTGRPGDSIRVDYYVDGPAGAGVPAGNAIADAVRQDVSPGNHGLRFTLPAQFFDGRLHTLYAYGIDATNDPNVLLTGAPRLFILPKRPIGFLEQIDAAGVAGGWTLDPSLLGYGNPNTVDVLIDGFFVARVSANVPRSDIVGAYGYPGDHGFRWPIPPDWRDGQPHTLSIRANDLTGDEPRDLPGSPKQFTLTRRKAAVDFDGDFRTDIAIFRPGNGQWWYLPSASPPGSVTVTFGQSGDIPVPADYDGDGRTDVAVYRNGTWFVLQSTTQNVLSVAFGQPGDKPVPSDYNGDGYADIAVFRPSDGTWYIRPTGGDGGYYGVPYGLSTDRPVPGDYDADGIADVAVYRPLVGAWIVHQSSNGQDVYTQFGLSSDRVVPADYDGDGRTDRAVFRPSTGTWHILQSIDGRYVQVQHGVAGDQVAAGDYDGDGKADQAVFRPSTGIWYVHQSRDGDLATSFGAPGDVAVMP